MKLIFTILIISCCSSLLTSQSVGVNTTTPDPSAALDIQSTTQGMLVPRVTTAQRTAIFGPATGLMVFDVTTNSFWFKSSTKWTELIDSSHAAVHKTGNNYFIAAGGGYVGIGTTTPNAPLQFSNAIANRKVVLFENVNNDNQYFGLGINSGQMRYQVDAQVSSHVFYAATGPASSNELMRINGNGNVGIGTNAPAQKLQVQGSAYVTDKVGIGVSSPNSPLQFTNAVANRKVVLYETANNDNQFYGLGVNASQLRYQVDAVTSNHVFYAATGSGGSNELLRISGNGNVGIGTINPNSPLQFSNAFLNRKIVLHESANNDNQYNGFGVNSATMRYQVGETTSDHVFYAATSPTTSNELMRIKGNGNVNVAGNVNINGSVMIGYEIVTNSDIISPLSSGMVTCNCPPGKKVIGGGWSTEWMEVDKDLPVIDGSGWLVDATNNGLFDDELTVWAICVRVGN